MRGIPGMQVVCPADVEELVAALPAAVESGRPTYVRYNARPAAVHHVAPFALGRAEVLSEGDGVALLTSGFLLAEADRARVLLEARGVGVRLVNLRSLDPVDEAAIREAAARTELLVTIEDHFRTGGLATIVAEVLLRARTAPRVLSLALDDRWFEPLLLRDVLVREGFTGRRIAERVLDALLAPGKES
jgi:transketolase